jgi:hypothetical protein
MCGRPRCRLGERTGTALLAITSRRSGSISQASVEASARQLVPGLMNITAGQDAKPTLHGSYLALAVAQVVRRGAEAVAHRSDGARAPLK